MSGRLRRGQSRVRPLGAPVPLAKIRETTAADLDELTSASDADRSLEPPLPTFPRLFSLSKRRRGRAPFSRRASTPSASSSSASHSGELFVTDVVDEHDQSEGAEAGTGRTLPDRHQGGDDAEGADMAAAAAGEAAQAHAPSGADGAPAAAIADDADEADEAHEWRLVADDEGAGVLDNDDACSSAAWSLSDWSVDPSSQCESEWSLAARWGERHAAPVLYSAREERVRTAVTRAQALVRGNIVRWRERRARREYERDIGGGASGGASSGEAQSGVRARVANLSGLVDRAKENRAKASDFVERRAEALAQRAVAAASAARETREAMIERSRRVVAARGEMAHGMTERREMARAVIQRNLVGWRERRARATGGGSGDVRRSRSFPRMPTRDSFSRSLHKAKLRHPSRGAAAASSGSPKRSPELASAPTSAGAGIGAEGDGALLTPPLMGTAAASACTPSDLALALRMHADWGCAPSDRSEAVLVCEKPGLRCWRWRGDAGTAGHAVDEYATEFEIPVRRDTRTPHAAQHALLHRCALHRTRAPPPPPPATCHSTRLACYLHRGRRSAHVASTQFPPLPPDRRTCRPSRSLSCRRNSQSASAGTAPRGRLSCSTPPVLTLSPRCMACRPTP